MGGRIADCKMKNEKCKLKSGSSGIADLGWGEARIVLFVSLSVGGGLSGRFRRFWRHLLDGGTMMDFWICDR
jgi:hypothetical protein